MTKRTWISMAFSGLILAPSLVLASAGSLDSAAAPNAEPTAIPKLSLDPVSQPDKPAADPADAHNSDYMRPSLTLDAGAAPPSRIHGFGDLKFATAYMTPRGLVVEDAGLVVQPLFGLVFDLYHGDGVINSVDFNAGIWSSLHSHHVDADIWNECDLFAGFDVKFLNKFTFSVTSEIWLFPDVSTKAESDPETEYNMEFKLSYDDSELLKDFAVHPYVNFFWNYSGPSPVVLGQRTFYVEIGGAPSYTFKGIPDLPITFSFPTYFTFGDSSFWGTDPVSGDRSNLGVFSTGVKASIPLKFVPAEFGGWSAYVGMTYLHQCNPALTRASDIVGSGYDHDRIVGYAGVGFGF